MLFSDKIEIKCNTGQTLPFSEITPFYGNPKKRTKEDINKIRDTILETGFSFPFFIWKTDKNYCLDGNGRLEAIKLLSEKGQELPDFPVVYIDAADEIEAKEKVLQLNSSYGMITKDGLAEFSEGLEIDLAQLSFTDSIIDFSGNVFSEEGDLSPRQNLMKIATFERYQIPVSESEIQILQERITEYVEENQGLGGFFDHFLTLYSLEKQQEIN
jgi:hypothetical protein